LVSVDSTIVSQLAPAMDHYPLRSKGELSRDQVPVSVTTQPTGQYTCTSSQLVQPASLFGPGTPPEGQAAAQLPAAASQETVSPLGTDRTDPTFSIS